MPGVTLVTKPVNEPIVATAGVLLLQEPPIVALLSIVVAVLQIANVPVIGATDGFTVINCVATQPAPEIV